MKTKFFQKQSKLLGLIHNPKYTDILAYGGIRSGKTLAILEDMIATAWIYKGSRQLVVRTTRVDLKRSIWMDTLPRVLSSYPNGSFTTNESEMYLTLANGSQIFFDGLDSADRAEKIFGTEYCRIFLNEVSQMDYQTVLKIKTRLAQVVVGLQNKMLYDENPSMPTHWTHKMFIQKRDPISDAVLDNVVSIKMNPTDNPFLSSSYIASISTLPEAMRRRFLLGEFVPQEHCVYSGIEFFDDGKPILEKASSIFGGVDFGFSDPNVFLLLAQYDNDIYIIDEIYNRGQTPPAFGKEIIEMLHKHDLNPNNIYIYCDDAQPDKIEQLCQEGLVARAASKGKIDDGINAVRMHKIFINRECSKSVEEIPSYSYKIDKDGHRTEMPVSTNDHTCDSLRYGIVGENSSNYLPMAFIK